ncbi:MAG TPA: glycosyltransferase [Jatrophihabitans sp.]|jgi:galactofuranosylgalactofuranosylrhamnosyl-N-acetylglucosaminyl-diphospho-decaprenol beta-1,5/1,6-galactofuranosyltransferase
MTEFENPRGMRVLQRVVLPLQGNLDVVPLYVETNMERGANLAPVDTERESEQQEQKVTAVPSATPGEAQSAVRFGTQATSSGDLAARRSARMEPGRRVSFGSYFNAFPASYWRRWTIVEDVVLRVRVEGECTVIVYRSTAKGHSHPVESRLIDNDGPETIEIKLPLSQFIDGGWYWFDIAAASRGVTLIEADWATRTERLEQGRFSIAMTTFNRPDYCVDNLRVLAESPDLLEVIDHVYVADQGTQRVEDHEDFVDATKGLGAKLKIINQGNLGGSGGFSRGMDETVREGASDYVLLLDDDVVTEPESMLRAITFADLARRPTIVGGHMFSMYDRSVLHSYGETIARYNWWWGAAPRTVHEHDFGRRNLRNTPWLHRRVDVDYNGWWMCLIPTSVVRQLGLSLPVFIKWDDAEYGLRAKGAGVPVVSMPGVAVWHVPWQDKNDALDWQAYYHLRNRLVTALLHSPYPRGGSVVNENLEFQIRHLLSMQYSTAKLRLMAIEDVLAGPEHLHSDILTKMGSLREVRAEFADSQSKADIESFPEVRRLKPPRRGKEPTSPTNKLGLFIKAALGAVRQVLPVSELAKDHPQLVVPSQDAEWWLLSNSDGALVSSADGTTTSWYQRDPELFRTLMTQSLAAHARLSREWPKLRKRYLDAAADVTSPQRWRETFQASVRKD